jgi:hypothetical protein
MVAGAGSTGGILAVGIGTFGKLFKANLFGKAKEKEDDNDQRTRQ